jgi:hypothetical protein
MWKVGYHPYNVHHLLNSTAVVESPREHFSLLQEREQQIIRERNKALYARQKGEDNNTVTIAELEKQRREEAERTRLLTERERIEVATRFENQRLEEDECLRQQLARNEVEEEAKVEQEQLEENEHIRLAEESNRAEAAAKVERQRSMEQQARILQECRKFEAAALFERQRQAQAKPLRQQVEGGKAKEAARAEKRILAERQPRITQERQKAEAAALLEWQCREQVELVRQQLEQDRAKEVVKAEQRRLTEEQTRIAQELQDAEAEVRLSQKSHEKFQLVRQKLERHIVQEATRAEQRRLEKTKISQERENAEAAAASLEEWRLRQEAELVHRRREQAELARRQGLDRAKEAERAEQKRLEGIKAQAI